MLFLKYNQPSFMVDKFFLIANELVEDARRLEKDMLLFKVDFEKVFDSVDWCYHDAVMRNMNFLTL